jgi:hypothetical protein
MTGSGGDFNGGGSTNELDVFQFALEWQAFFTSLTKTGPMDREAERPVSRETILEFNNPLDDSTAAETAIFAEFGDQILPARLNLSSDLKKLTMCYVDPYPKQSRVRLFTNGDRLMGESGGLVDADQAGEAGGESPERFRAERVRYVKSPDIRLSCGNLRDRNTARSRSGESLDGSLQRYGCDAPGRGGMMGARAKLSSGSFLLLSQRTEQK